MKRFAQIISFLALAGTLAPPLLYFADRLDLPHTQLAMLIAAGVWFLTAPLWMEHRAT